MAIETNDKLEEVNTAINESLEPYFTDMYKAGEVKEQLEIGKEVKDITTASNNYIVKTGTYTAGSTSLVTVALPFTPKYIKFTFFLENSATWPTWSDGMIDTTSQQCLARKYTLTTQLIQQEFKPTDAFYVQEFVSSSVCYGNVNLGTNNFNFQADQNTFSLDLKYIAECFG